MMPFPTLFEPRKHRFVGFASRLLFLYKLSHLYTGEDIYNEAMIRLSRRPEELWNDAYLYKTISNLVSDKLRRRREYLLGEDEVVSTEDTIGIPGEEARVRLQAFFSGVLKELEHRFAGASASRIDSFAVLLLELRFIVHSELRRTEQSRESVGANAMADIIEAVVPWTDAQAARSFREGWPSIGGIWGWLVPMIDRMELMSAEKFIDIYNGNVPSGQALNQNLWYAWVNRARKQLIDWEMPEPFMRLIFPGSSRVRKGAS